MVCMHCACIVHAGRAGCGVCAGCAQCCNTCCLERNCHYYYYDHYYLLLPTLPTTTCCLERNCASSTKTHAISSRADSAASNAKRSVLPSKTWG